MIHKKQTPLSFQEKELKGFTLVELIVVVTILAILATIGFVSYSSYLTGVRDTNRLAQLVSISDGLELYRTKNDLPLPDDNVEVQTNGSLIAYQGYAGSNTLETIDFTKGGKDPKDDTYFTYYLTADRKYYQLMGFLEEDVNITSHNSPSPLRRGLGGGVAHAVDYSNRIPTVYGKKLGVLTDDENTPIQDLGILSLDLETEDTSDYVAYISDTSTLTGSTVGNSLLVYSAKVASAGGIFGNCKSILDKNRGFKNQDGMYLIEADGKIIDVYCDMSIDGGGWTKLLDENGDVSDRVSHFAIPGLESTRYPGYYNDWTSTILPVHNEVLLANYCEYSGDWRREISWEDKNGEKIIFSNHDGDFLEEISDTYYSHFDRNDSNFEVECPGGGGRRWLDSARTDVGLGGRCVNSYAKGIIRNVTLGNNARVYSDLDRTAVRCEIFVR